MGVRTLAAPQHAGVAEVDIVAVHGIFEDSLETWTEPQTRNNWLCNLFPPSGCAGRILLYEYDRTGLIFPSSGQPDRISSLATTFVEELCANRQCDNAAKRPIIFICHGFGGLLVKSGLAHSSDCLSDHLRHLRGLYVSTYAILFMGTPHRGMTQDSLAILSQRNKLPGPSQFSINLVRSDMLQDIEDRFLPLSRDFRLFNVWERRPTVIGNISTFIVNEASAAPIAEDIARFGLDASHLVMTKFADGESSGLKVLRAALQRYIHEAPLAIQTKWFNDQKHLAMVITAKVEALLHERDRLKRTDTEPATPVGESEYIQGFKRSGTGLSSPGSRTDHFFAGAPSPLWTGRSDHIQQIAQSLGSIRWRDSRSRPKIFVIHGLGGSGKTEICKKYALDNKEKYWGVFWIDSTSRMKLEDDCAQIGEEVGKGRNWQSGVHFLSRCSKSWLLVIDNADDRSLSLQHYIPAAGNGHVLITSRLKQSSNYSTVGHVQLRGMSPNDAILLLIRTSYPNTDYALCSQSERDMAGTVASELGYLAKALVHAGTTVAMIFKTLEKYLNHYLGQRQRLLSTSLFRSAEETNIRATWEIPFQRLINQSAQEYKDAVDLIHLLAFVHFDRIPRRLARTAMLRGAGNNAQQPRAFSARRGSAFMDSSERVMHAITLLVDYSLLEHDLDNDFYYLHPIVHEWARERLEESQQKHWLSVTMDVIAECISSCMEASQAKFRKQLLRHINSCLETYKHYFSNTYAPANPAHCISLERFAAVLSENGQWKQAKTLMTSVVEFRERTSGLNSEDTLRSQQQLGEILWNLFDVASAIKVQRRVMEGRWRLRPSLGWWTPSLILKPEHVGYCLALSDLTRSLWLAGLRDLSQRAGERAVQGLSKHLGRDDPLTLNAMFNLGRTYLHVGELQQSLRMLQWVFDRRTHFFGSQHLDTLMAKEELGMILCEQGEDLARAERLVSEVLLARTEILGDEHAYTLWSVNDLSKILCTKGEPDRAVSMLENIIPIVERTLGEDHVGMTMTKGNLARAYGSCERWTEAEELLAALLQNMPHDHPDLVPARLGLAKVRIRTKQLHAARSDLVELLSQISEQASSRVYKREAEQLLEDAQTVDIADEVCDCGT